MLLFLFQNSISTLVTAVAPIFAFQHDKIQYDEDNDEDDNDYWCNSNQSWWCLKSKINAPWRKHTFSERKANKDCYNGMENATEQKMQQNAMPIFNFSKSKK